MARLRCDPLAKLTAISDRAVGAAIAPPMPWSTRAAMSHVSLVANPPSIDATVNTAMPIRNMRDAPGIDHPTEIHVGLGIFTLHPVDTGHTASPTASGITAAWRDVRVALSP